MGPKIQYGWWLMQLVAYGAQDVYLTGNPKVTFFQAVYRRHTNFAMENIEQTVNGTASNNGRVSVTVARNGDLIGDMYVELKTASDLGTKAGITTKCDGCWAAERAIKDVELSIGGQRIDKHYQTWWRLYSELYLDGSKKAQYGKMTSNPVSDTAGTSTSHCCSSSTAMRVSICRLSRCNTTRCALTSICPLSSLLTRTVPPSRSGATTCTSTPRSVAASRKRVMNTSLSKCNTPVRTPSPPVPPSKSACPTTTRSRSLSGVWPVPALRTRKCGTSRPKPVPRVRLFLN